jgi:hypothetical protein
MTKDEARTAIVEAFNQCGVHGVKLNELKVVEINRTDAMNSFFGRGYHEFDLIEKLYGVASSAVGPNIYVMWAGKTDESWFMDVMVKGVKDV